jgi:1-acyl-sn-glycerol-3-phosphate acyltransferase
VSLARWAVCGATAAALLGPGCVLGPVAPTASADLLRRWARLSCDLFGIRVELEDRNRGRYDEPPYLFVQLNQTSLAETFVLSGRLPVEHRILMNLGYALVPFVGWLQVAIGGVVVVQQSPRLARRAIERATGMLRRGISFAISIEGKRSPDGKLGAYKKGPAVLAIAAGATIIPYFLEGARERLPVGAWRVTPGDVRVVLCEGIRTRGLSYEDRDRIVDELRGLAAREGLD